MANVQSFRGVIPILVTPFTDSGQVDIPGQLRVVDHLWANGARQGFGVFGNAGEGYTLMPAERRQLLEAIVRHVGDSTPLIVGVGATGTDAAVEACRVAEGQGAAGLMVLPPYYLRPDGDGLMYFYGRISDAVSIPIMVQDAPMLSQVPMPPGLLARLGKEVEQVRYVKVEAPPTAPKISKVAEVAGDSLALFGGLNGQFMIEEWGRGASGTMPASDMTWLFCSVWTALESGDVESAWRTFRRALPLIRYELQPGLGVAAVKENLARIGVIASSAVRHPTRQLDAVGLRELEELRSVVGPVWRSCP